jgi:P4 family phage/plasmid primase-like protien
MGGEEVLVMLERYLRETYPEDVLMPLKSAGRKEPRYAHRGGRWTWSSYDAFRSKFRTHTEFGVLLKTLCAIDVDDEDTARLLEEEFECLGRAPMERTSKGRHYMFVRPASADAEGFYDGARQHGAVLKADFKSVCSTGTSGLLVCAPSAGKEWVRPPWYHAPFELPRALLERVARSRIDRGLKVDVTKDPKVETKSTPRPGAFECAPKDDPVYRLLSLLSKTRWDLRSSWVTIATALKNEHGDTYRDLYLQLSRISPKFDEADALRTWASVSRQDYDGPRVTLGTIHAWARQDDPVGYAEYRASVIPAVVLDNWDKEDYGLAAITKAILGDRIKKTGSKGGQVYYFDEQGQRWRSGTEASLHKMITEALEEALRDVEVYYTTRARAEGGGDEAQRATFDAKKRQVSDRLRYIRRHGGITNVTAESLPLFQDDAFEQLLDSKAHLLGVKNGVVDLRTGMRRPRAPEDMIFTVLDVPFDPAADTSDMDALALSCMAGDASLAAYLQKLFGYGITGETCEEVFVVLTGSGRNGKGGLTQTIAKVLSTFYKAMNSGLICERQVSNVDAERGKLLGARLAVFDELKAGERLKTHEVQLLSGGDGIPARPLYKDPVTVTPRHLCILSTNHLPELTEVIPAIMLRLLIVHFPVTFTDLLEGETETPLRRQADHSLKRRLEANLPGVLRWLVQGAVAWYAAPGLRRQAPAKVLEFSRAYFEEQDRLAAFLSQRCRVGDGLRVRTSALLGALNSFLAGEEINERWSDKSLASAMKVKGFEKKKLRVCGDCVNCFTGLELIQHTSG